MCEVLLRVGVEFPIQDRKGYNKANITFIALVSFIALVAVVAVVSNTAGESRGPSPHPKGDATAPTLLHTTPAPTRLGTPTTDLW